MRELAAANLTMDALRFITASIASLAITLSTVFGQDALES
jgi:hypothetical protein